MEKYIDLLMKLVKKAYKNNEVPVGCIIIRNKKVVVTGYNKREKRNDPTSHAEIVAIRKACKKLKNWRLDDCEMFVTLKPCHMCEAVIKECRIKRVYYLVDKTDRYKSKSVNINYIKVENNGDVSNLLKNFFKTFRK